MIGPGAAGEGPGRLRPSSRPPPPQSESPGPAPGGLLRLRKAPGAGRALTRSARRRAPAPRPRLSLSPRPSPRGQLSLFQPGRSLHSANARAPTVGPPRRKRAAAPPKLPPLPASAQPTSPAVTDPMPACQPITEPACVSAGRHIPATPTRSRWPRIPRRPFLSSSVVTHLPTTRPRTSEGQSLYLRASQHGAASRKSAACLLGPAEGSTRGYQVPGFHSPRLLRPPHFCHSLDEAASFASCRTERHFLAVPRPPLVAHSSKR